MERARLKRSGKHGLLWVTTCVMPLFAINDIRLLGRSLTATVQLGMRCVLVGWAACLLTRLTRPIERAAKEAAGRAKTRFLATVSHEVRTPMDGVLQLLESSRLDALQRRQVAIARECAENLTGLLDMSIDYARLGASIETPIEVDFDPWQWVQGIVELMRPRAAAQRTAVQMRIDDSVPPALHADTAKLCDATPVVNGSAAIAELEHEAFDCGIHGSAYAADGRFRSRPPHSLASGARSIHGAHRRADRRPDARSGRSLCRPVLTRRVFNNFMKRCICFVMTLSNRPSQ